MKMPIYVGDPVLCIIQNNLVSGYCVTVSGSAVRVRLDPPFGQRQLHEDVVVSSYDTFVVVKMIYPYYEKVRFEFDMYPDKMNNSFYWLNNQDQFVVENYEY